MVNAQDEKQFVSKEEVLRARQPDLLTFLQIYNPSDLKGSGEVYHLKSHDSLKISNGKWCWWSRNKMGGTSALDYLMNVENMAFVDAVKCVNNVMGIYISAKSPPKPKPAPKKPEFVLPPASENNKRVMAYLCKTRGIDIEIIKDCFRRKLIYEEAKSHNAVFVGYDGTIPKYAARRGTIPDKKFMGEVSGSHKKWSFYIGNSSVQTLQIFESAIDALSYLTMVKLSGRDWKSANCLSLGGVYGESENQSDTMPLALEQMLTQHKFIEKIIIRLDSDEVGHAAVRSIQRLLSDKNVTAIFPNRGKDYNEWMLMTRQRFFRESSENGVFQDMVR